MTSTIASYNQISTRLTAWTRATSAGPVVSREIKSYDDRIGNIKTIDQFLSDDRVYSFAMKAFGLSEMSYAKAFMRKVLAEGVDSPTAFANKLADKRYAQFAATFNFKRYGETTTVFEGTRQGTVDRYVRATLEESAGSTNENVRLSLYFERVAPTVSSPYSILADRALTKVVYTALGLPAATSAMDIDAQARLITSRMDLADLRSPQKLSKFIARFAGQADASTGVSLTAPALSILSGQGSANLSASALLAIQSFRSALRAT